MENFSYKKALELANISYLGNTRHSAKLNYSYNNGVETYGIYLAPATLARDEKHPHLNTCPFSQVCAKFCLNGAGHNKCSKLHSGIENLSKIDQARIRKTHLFYDDRETFMQILIHELSKAKERAERKGMGFAVRLNCTSDINIEQFVYKGKNILEIFPNVQFYDYTKVPKHLELVKKYPNYDLTFSYDGLNINTCLDYLKKGGRVAVVFDILDRKGKQTLPTEWEGYRVIDANGYDMRYMDPNGVICGLHYHRVANDYKNGKYVGEETPFVIRH